MPKLKSKEENNALWNLKIDKIYEEIDLLHDKMTKEQDIIQKEINRRVEKYNKFLESKAYKVTAKTPKTVERQLKVFETERLQREEELKNNNNNLRDNIKQINLKYLEKIKVLEDRASKSKLNLYTYDKPQECEFCPGVFYQSEAEKIKHQDSLLYQLNAGLIDPIENGLCCNLCSKTFTQYHAVPEKNPEYLECLTNCRLKYKPPKGKELEDLYDKLEEMIEVIEVTIENQRPIFQWLDILNERNRVAKMCDRLYGEYGAYHYAWGEERKYTEKEDIKLKTFLSIDRTYLYSMDFQGNEEVLCEVRDADETDGFGKGKILIMPQREIGYDLRDRNPFIRLPPSNLLRDRPLSKEEYNNLRIGKALEKGERNIYDLQNESIEERKVLQHVLKETPENKKVTRTTTTTTN